MSPSGYISVSDHSSPLPFSSHDDLFSGSSCATTPSSSPARTMEQPQLRHQEFELDLGLDDMDLVPYISPDGEYKVWDRNDSGDDEAAEEFKLCGSDKEREDALESWKIARRQESIQEEAEAKAAAEKEENDWYLEMTGMSAAEWKKVNAAKERAAKELEAKAAEAITPDSDTPAPDTEEHDHDDHSYVEACDDDGGARLEVASPRAPAHTSVLDSTPTGASAPIPAKEKGLIAKEIFALDRKERNSEKRAAKNAAASSSSTTKNPVANADTPKTIKSKINTLPKHSAVQTASSTTDTPTLDAHVTTSHTEINDNDDGLEAELLAELEAELEAEDEAEDEADGGAQLGNQANVSLHYDTSPHVLVSSPTSGSIAGSDDDGLEAELLAALEAEEEADGGALWGKETDMSSTCNTAPYVLSSSPARGGTAASKAKSPPHAETQTDAESDAGSDMSPEEWAAMDGESTVVPAQADGGGAARPLTTIGHKRMEKMKVKRSKAASRALTWTIFNSQVTTSLNQAVVHIQSKPADKARDIFIDTRLADMVIHGRSEADELSIKNSTSVLPKLYHLYWESGPNYRLLAKHMDLQTDVKLNEVYISLGLDLCRGKVLFTQIQKLLKTPGCSLRIGGDLVEEHKIKVGERAHQLLANVGWGQEHFQRPVLSGRDHKDKPHEKVSWSTASTEILLGFSKLLYKAAKTDEARRKGLNRRSHPQEATVPAPMEPSVTAPESTTTEKAAPPLPDHTPPRHTKRIYDMVDLTSDIEEVEVSPSLSKRARLSDQAAAAQRPRAEILQKQRPESPQAQHKQRQSQQRPPTWPQRSRVQQHPQNRSPQDQSPQDQSPLRPWSDLQSRHNFPQLPQALLQQPRMQQRSQAQAHPHYRSPQHPQP